MAIKKIHATFNVAWINKNILIYEDFYTTISLIYKGLFEKEKLN